MTTAELVFSQGTLTLSRPGTGDPTLRAWDAADELLLEEALGAAAAFDEPRVLVVDDQFGALTLGLSRLSPTVVADSALLPAALASNVSLNPEFALPESVFSWIDPPAGPFDLVVLRIPRQADYLAWLLRWLNGVMADAGVLLAGGMIKHLPAKSVDVFAEAVQTEQVLPARKKARAIRCRKGAPSLANWSATWKGYGLTGRNGDVAVEAMPAVFARENLDIGTRLLLPHVAKAVSTIQSGGSVLDLACGNGVLGLATLAERGDLQLGFSDVSSQALLSARHNVERAFPDASTTFSHSDGIVTGTGAFDLILLNPPFHEGGVIGDHIAQRLFEQASQHLRPGGRLLLVGNRHLGYHRSLRRYFSLVEQLDASPKFVVFRAGNR
ncbi:16S rRNA (guanine1207-N2)-methyltransferase [Marinobacter sp. es.048]|uniref:class I SAM-dependent methyltransferase n=1 Tax=Marinobacter sp. es.048 TaxID=1761795 RepID=UPI000B59461B|nr:methyltransferase [Marinobacter sp. es.048]SNC67344.1 16S rRNA (guanine1207-N2)-methyltransferase [Marinobacter sp. es.048]